jgi:hypothetical protein
MLNTRSIKLIGLFLIFSQISFGQYKSIFGQYSTKWNIIPYGVCDGMTSITVSVIGDSIINSNNYKEVDRYSLFSEDNGFLREDTIAGKVWFYNKTIAKEILVVDLSLNETDSFKIYNYALDSTYIYVDTLFINNGIKHIRFKHCYIHICAPDEQFEFIEGTGTNAGLFYIDTWDANASFSYLLCHEKDGKKIYGNSLFNDTCFVDIVGINDVIRENDVEIFPNPTKDLVTFRFKNQNNETYHLIIYNASVQLTHSISTSESEIQIFFNDKSTGINYFVLISNHKLIKTGKILKI